MPALYIMALWLKDLRGSDDRLLPMPPAPRFLRAGRFYAAAEFTGLLTGPAQRRLAMRTDRDAL
jgi:hypothetical protein